MGRGPFRITWRIRVTRSFWYPRGYRILHKGLILHANPRYLAAARGQPLPLTCCTPEIVPCAVCNAEPTDEVPVIAAWMAVQMASDTFG